MSDYQSLEILSNIDAQKITGTFKSITIKSESDKDGVVIDQAGWTNVINTLDEHTKQLSKTVSTDNTNLQTITGSLRVNAGIQSNKFSAGGDASNATAIEYLGTSQGFKYSNIYQMYPNGSTTPFFNISTSGTVLSATDVNATNVNATNLKGTNLFENGQNINQIYAKKSDVPSLADTYNKSEIDAKVSTLNTSIAAKQNKLTAGSNISISTSGSTTTINTKNIYTNTEVDTAIAKKQDTLVPGTNLIAGQNVTISKSSAGAITISSTGGVSDAYTKAETDALLLKKQNALTAGSNISISTSGSTTTINTKDIYTSAQVDTALATKQDTLVPGTNLIAGDNININKDADNKITIAATLEDLTDLINRVTALETALETSLGGYKLKAVTQAEYDELTTKEPNTLYFIKGS